MPEGQAPARKIGKYGGKMFRYCPSCASENIRFEKGKVFHCPDCGFTYYHNIAAATGCVISTKAGILFLVRGKDPSRGKIDLPGGFVDPGEGAIDGLYRELREEIGWEIYPNGDLRCELFASFPNKYPYKNIPYNTCDLFFTINAPDLDISKLKRQESEISAIRFIKPGDIKMEELAFESTKRAMEEYLAHGK
jgi:ADP-ribose pyrophosphatase YjhB (NUDIX family)